jgi:hypothetical protein
VFICTFHRPVIRWRLPPLSWLQFLIWPFTSDRRMTRMHYYNVASCFYYYYYLHHRRDHIFRLSSFSPISFCAMRLMEHSQISHSSYKFPYKGLIEYSLLILFVGKTSVFVLKKNQQQNNMEKYSFLLLVLLYYYCSHLLGCIKSVFAEFVYSNRSPYYTEICIYPSTFNRDVLHTPCINIYFY